MTKHSPLTPTENLPDMNQYASKRYDSPHPQDVVDTLVGLGSNTPPMQNSVDPAPSSQQSPKRPGRKRDPNTVQNRKVQNRIAQREFRQRKQAYIKELEAKVSYLSQDKNVQTNLLQSYVHALVDENRTLRSVISSLGNLLGNTTSELVKKAEASFVEYDEKSQTFTVGKISNNYTNTDVVAKSSPFPSPSLSANGSSLSSTSPLTTPAIAAPRGNNTNQANSNFNIMPSPTSSMDAVRSRLFNNIDEVSYGKTNDCASSMDFDPRTHQAIRILCYHIDNAKKADKDGRSYTLPSSLRPTSLQSLIPHESAIDYLPQPSLRDRMIIHRNKLHNINAVLKDIFTNIYMGEGDDLDPATYEIKRNVVEKYPVLFDNDVIAQGNYWRRKRGEREITICDNKVIDI